MARARAQKETRRLESVWETEEEEGNGRKEGRGRKERTQGLVNLVHSSKVRIRLGDDANNALLQVRKGGGRMNQIPQLPGPGTSLPDRA